MKKEIINEEFGLSSGDTVVVKVGSNVLAGNENGVNLGNLKNIVNSVDYLMNIGLNVFLVSSGAVAIGRNIEKAKHKVNEDKSKIAFYSTIGQSKLIELYFTLFNQKTINISQNLLTHRDFEDEKTFNHLKEVWKHNTRSGVLAIINENDAISSEELGFSDNDELAGKVAIATNAKILFLLSDVMGLYENYGQDNEKIIRKVSDISKVESEVVENLGQDLGKGGAKSKLNVMQEMMNNGIIGILTAGNWDYPIKDSLEGSDTCTIFRV